MNTVNMIFPPELMLESDALPGGGGVRNVERWARKTIQSLLEQPEKPLGKSGSGHRRITVRVSGVTELAEPVRRSSCARSGERFQTNGLEITRWRDELSISEGDAWIMIDLIGEWIQPLPPPHTANHET